MRRVSSTIRRGPLGALRRCVLEGAAGEDAGEVATVGGVGVHVGDRGGVGVGECGRVRSRALSTVDSAERPGHGVARRAVPIVRIVARGGNGLTDGICPLARRSSSYRFHKVDRGYHDVESGPPDGRSDLVGAWVIQHVDGETAVGGDAAHLQVPGSRRQRRPRTDPRARTRPRVSSQAQPSVPPQQYVSPQQYVPSQPSTPVRPRTQRTAAAPVAAAPSVRGTVAAVLGAIGSVGCAAAIGLVSIGGVNAHHQTPPPAHHRPPAQVVQVQHPVVHH